MTTLSSEELQAQRSDFGLRLSNSMAKYGPLCVGIDPHRKLLTDWGYNVDAEGALWIEDYGSLNGTYIITNGQETQVTKGTPLKLSAPATVRIGDQFFQFTEKQA